MISTPAACALRDRPVRLGMRQRHAGRQHERRKPRPVGAREIDERQRRPSAPPRARLAVVPGGDRRAARRSARAGRDARCAEAENRHRLAGKCGAANHAPIVKSDTPVAISLARRAPRLAQLQRRKADQRQDHGDDPEAHHDGRSPASPSARSGGAAAPFGTRACPST